MTGVADGRQHAIHDDDPAIIAHRGTAVPKNEGRMVIVPIGQKIAEHGDTCSRRQGNQKIRRFQATPILNTLCGKYLFGVG